MAGTIGGGLRACRRSYNPPTHDASCRSAGRREHAASAVDVAGTIRGRIRACRRSYNLSTRDAFCMEIASTA